MDVVGRYSNGGDLLKRLRRTQRLGASTSDREAAVPARVHAVERRLDQVARHQLVDDYVAGSPTTDLIGRYHLGKGTVLGVLRRAGVELRNQGLRPGDLQRAVALYESGLSCKGVAEHVSCDAETMRQALRQAGVEMRKPWERG